MTSFKFRAPLTLMVVLAVAIPVFAQDVIETSVISTLGADRPSQATELDSYVQANPISLLFATMDTDFDKYVTRAELDASVEREWASMLPSFSGKVSALKYEDWAIATLGAADAQPTRMSFDRDFDNQVSKSEFAERLAARFKELDIDEDTRLSRAELIHRVARRGERSDSGSQRGSQQQSGQGGGMGGGGQGR